jgi:hypothetical protein
VVVRKESGAHGHTFWQRREIITINILTFRIVRLRLKRSLSALEFSLFIHHWKSNVGVLASQKNDSIIMKHSWNDEVEDTPTFRTEDASSTAIKMEITRNRRT